MRAIIATGFALALAGSALAQDYNNPCNNIKTGGSTATLESQAACIKHQDEQLKLGQKRLQRAWKTVWNPMSLVELLGTSFDYGRDAQPNFVFSHARNTLEREIDKEGISSLRVYFADPDRLKAFYFSAGKEHGLLFTKSLAILGWVTDFANEVRVVLEKDFDPTLGRTWAEWRTYYCVYENDDHKDVCGANTFAADFQKAYGAPPSYTQAIMVGFLHRRYAEGAMPLVKAWQEIGMDFAEKISPKPQAVVATKEKKKLR